MGKGICRTYKNGQRNWPYPYPDTTFVLPQPPDTSIKTQFTSDSDVSVGAHTLSSPVSYQSTIPHGNNDVNNNDDALSFETPRKKVAVIPVLIKQSLQQPHQIHPNFLHLEKGI